MTEVNWIQVWTTGGVAGALATLASALVNWFNTDRSRIKNEKRDSYLAFMDAYTDFQRQEARAILDHAEISASERFIALATVAHALNRVDVTGSPEAIRHAKELFAVVQRRDRQPGQLEGAHYRFLDAVRLDLAVDTRAFIRESVGDALRRTRS